MCRKEGFDVHCESWALTFSQGMVLIFPFLYSRKPGVSWYNGSTHARVSDRLYAANADTSRYNNSGARCARTAP